MPVPAAPRLEDLVIEGDLTRFVRQRYGPSETIRSERPLGGGSIADVRLIETSAGEQLVVKRAGRESGTTDGPLAAEARGLIDLSAAQAHGGPRVPQVLGLVSGDRHSELVTEFMPRGPASADFAVEFGRSLAALHRGLRADGVGYARDNFIGSSPQRNAPGTSWIEFFATRRLEAQVGMARHGGHLSVAESTLAERLIARLGDLLPDVDGQRASLLHGDLWSGNVIAAQSGEPVIIDPAVYYGHREADLAMTELFGGFGAGFLRAYEEVWPLEPGYSERRDIYNLYHLLNHLNIFGSSYRGACLAILRRFSR